MRIDVRLLSRERALSSEARIGSKVVNQSKVKQSLPSDFRILRALLHIFVDVSCFVQSGSIQRLDSVIVKIAKLKHGLILRIRMVKRWLEIIESQILINTKWTFGIPRMLNVHGKVWIFRFKYFVFIKEQANIELSCTQPSFSQFHVDQGSFEILLLLNQFKRLFELLSLIPNVSHMLNESCSEGTTLVSPKSCKVHYTNIVSSESMAFFSCSFEMIVSLWEWEFYGLTWFTLWKRDSLTG